MALLPVKGLIRDAYRNFLGEGGELLSLKIKLKFTLLLIVHLNKTLFSKDQTIVDSQNVLFPCYVNIDTKYVSIRISEEQVIRPD